MSLTGWAEITARTRVAVQGLRAAPFIEAAYAIGLSRWAVLWRHILPNLRDVLLIEAAAALSAALLIVAELGFFSIIGGGAEDFYGSKYPDPIYAEWGQHAGQSPSPARSRNLAADRTADRFYYHNPGV